MIIASNMHKTVYILLLMNCGIFYQVKAKETNPSTVSKYIEVGHIHTTEIEEFSSYSEEESLTTLNFLRDIAGFSPHVVDIVESYFKSQFVRSNISEQCVADWLSYFKAFKMGETWALKMADSTGRLPFGVMSGTKIDIGDFDQCIQIKTNLPSKMKGNFCTLCFQIGLVNQRDLIMPDGRTYLETYGQPPSWFEDMQKKYHYYMDDHYWCLGTCLPSTCSDQDVTNLFSNISNTWATKTVNNGCYVDEPKKWPVLTVIATWLLLLLVGCCILGTILNSKSKSQKSDDHRIVEEGTFKKILQCFSLTSNIEKLTQKRQSSSPMDCLEGIRVIMNLWIIAIHIFGYPHVFKYMKYSNYLYTFTISKIARPLGNSFVIIEIYFVMSGLFFGLTTYKTMKRNGGRINIVKFINQKYWRFMPVFAVLYLIVFIMPILYSGPLYLPHWNREIARCTKYWWTNILFIQNFIHADEICMIPSWFIAVLLQLSLASVAFLYIFIKSPKFGTALIALAITACIYRDYYVALEKNFSLHHEEKIKHMRDVNNFTSEIYFKPFNHFTSFMIGVWISTFSLKSIRFSRKTEILGWIVSLCTFIGIIYFVELPVKSQHHIALYYTLRNPIWCLAVTWCLLALFTGHGGILNKFLSSEIFAPFARISYSSYAFHILVYLFRETSRRERVYASFSEVVYQFASCATFTIILAAIGYVMVELPFNNLYSLLFKECDSSQGKRNKIK